MSRKTKRRLRSAFIRLTALVMTFLSVFLSSAPIFANEISPPAEGVTSGEVYMLKNLYTGKYLTLPGYFDVYPNEESEASRNNIYQSTAKINDEYSRAVRITYLTNTGEYTLCPLLFENFNGGYIGSTPSRNVELFVTLSAATKWTIEYIENKGAYVIKNHADQVLATYGTGNGGLNYNSSISQGNIIVEDYMGRDDQMWILEARTGTKKINPHIFKSDGSVTKKNLGTGAEWIFKLSDSEMSNNDVSITSLTVSGSHNDLISYAINGKYILVKMNADTVTADNKWDNYVAIQIAVRYSSEIIGEGSTSWRTVVVQDSGTGSGDGCKTIAIHNPARMHTVIINEGSPANFIITFKSDIQNVNIYRWEDNHDKSVLDYESYSPNLVSDYFPVDLKGYNFAIIKALNVGYTTIVAENLNGEIYRTILEVQTVSSDGVINSSPNVINMIGSENTDHETPLRIHLEYSSSYLLKTGSQLVLDGEWRTAIRSGAYLAETGANYAIFTTVAPRKPDESYVDNKQFYEDDVWLAAGTSPRYAKFLLDKEPEYYLPDGVYFIKKLYLEDSNKEYLSSESISANSRMSDPNQEYSDVRLDLYSNSAEHLWELKYLKHKAAYVVLSTYNKNYALSLEEDEVDEAGSVAVLSEYDENSVSDNQLWTISYVNDAIGYSLRNIATSANAGKLFLMGTETGVVKLSRLEIEYNSKEEIINDNTNTFIWSFESPPLSDWIYVCENCTEQNLTQCTHYEIGYWFDSPKVYITIDPSCVTTNYSMEAVLANCIQYYNDELNLNIQLAPSSEIADINIYVLNNTGEVEDGVVGITSPQRITYTQTVMFQNKTVTVHRYDLTNIAILAHNNESIFKWTLYHEMAHALGIHGHSLNSNHLMHTHCVENNENTYYLSEAELCNLKYIYEVYSNG